MGFQKLQPTLYPFRLPLPCTNTSRSLLVVSNHIVINGSTDVGHFVGTVDWEDGGTDKTVSYVHFLCASATQFDGASRLRVSIQSASDATNSTPRKGNGTAARSGTVATVAAGALSASMTSGSGVVSHGAMVAVVFDTAAPGVFTTGDDYAIASLRANDSVMHDPAVSLNNTAMNGIPCVVLEASDGKYGMLRGGGYVGQAPAELLFTSSGTSEYGVLFRTPVKVKASGLWFAAAAVNRATSTCEAVLYSAPLSGSPVAVATAVNAHKNWNNSTSSTHGLLQLHFGSEVTLDAGTDYVVAIRATNATDGVRLTELQTVSGQSARGKMLPGGTTVYGVSRAGNSGAFAQTAPHKWAHCGVIVSHFDDGSGGSWTPNSGTAGTHIKVRVHPSAIGDTGVEGVVFFNPGAALTGPEIGEFTGQAFDGTLEAGAAVIKIPVTAFGGTGLVTTDTPVVKLRNADSMSDLIPAEVVVI
jgi:hypothetical protein